MLKPRKSPRRPPIWEMKSIQVIRSARRNWKTVGSWGKEKEMEKDGFHTWKKK
jgi:hypothetical protein